MSGTTIDQSGQLGLVYVGANVVIEQDSDTPPGDAVVVGFNTALLNTDLLSTFTVQDNATLILGAGINIPAGNNFVIGPSGTLELGKNVSIGILNEITFAAEDTSGVLLVEQGLNVDLLDNVSGFAPGDTVDFAGVGAPASPASYSDAFNGSNTDFVMTLANGMTESFAMAGNLTGDSFASTPDGHGGTDFTEVSCFAPGTRILTEAGEIEVQNLTIGDHAILANGDMAMIKFIGRRHFDLRRHKRRNTVCPIRIAAGAIANGIPSRDLTISPDHALLLDGALVQAKDLIDDICVTQDLSCQSITYYHVELETHGILLAEGTPAESYLDTGNRGMFDNVDEPLILHPDLMQMRREAESMAPLCHEGEILAAIRTKLHTRKQSLGIEACESWDIWAQVGSQKLSPSSNNARQTIFHLPAGTTELTLHTQVFSPAAFNPASPDRRQLGLAIATITTDSQPLPIETGIHPNSTHPRSAGDPYIWTKNEIRLHVPYGTKILTLNLPARPKIWRRNRQAA